MWKHLYIKRWGAPIYFCKDPPQSGIRDHFKLRHMAEATAFNAKKDKRKRSKKPALPPMEFTFALIVKRLEVGPSKVVFEGSSTIELACGTPDFEISIVNNLPDKTPIAYEAFYSEDSLENLRATLLVQRSSDSAVACIWVDLPLDEDTDMLSFGDVFASNNADARISNTRQENLGGEWMSTTSVSLSACLNMSEGATEDPSEDGTIAVPQATLHLQQLVSTECNSNFESLSSSDLLKLMTGTGKQIRWQLQ